MDVVKLYGQVLGSLAKVSPAWGQTYLKIGWGLMNTKFKVAPNKQLLKGDQYLATMMMSTMLKPLKDPEHSAIVSIFTPTEPLQEVGLVTYNVESFSGYYSGSQAELPCIHYTEDEGISETLCSYHKTFIGAAGLGLMPRPTCIAYTNLTCDANLLTFDYLSHFFDVPSFAVDVPLIPDDTSVAMVAEQLREMSAFLEKHTGKKIEEEALKRRLRRTKWTLDAYERYQLMRADKYIPQDLVTPLYCAAANNILLGTSEEEKYVKLLLEQAQTAEPTRGKRIYWMHVIPHWNKALIDTFSFNDRAQIVGSELAQAAPADFDPEKPYEAMARRMVYNSYNGSVLRRIEHGIKNAKEACADGVIWFNHWGCKHTIGSAQLAKEKFEEAGLPFLILDGDGCDRSHGGEGQTKTRVEAFLEMLEA
ncbi:MAG: 2-hydroxyacyl-CoA dehydratase subunit D [Eggerthellaceae bacterium]|jgi:benzoyl-CoA reductase/2-hydroxyglutaryl-CoA dehydratase subunit BcrC/BadD/HgdB